MPRRKACHLNYFVVDTRKSASCHVLDFSGIFLQRCLLNLPLPDPTLTTEISRQPDEGRKVRRVKKKRNLVDKFSLRKEVRPVSITSGEKRPHFSFFSSHHHPLYKHCESNRLTRKRHSDTRPKFPEEESAKIRDRRKKASGGDRGKCVPWPSCRPGKSGTCVSVTKHFLKKRNVLNQ